MPRRSQNTLRGDALPLSPHGDFVALAPRPHMPIELLDAMERGDFEEVVALNDAKSGLKAFLCLHDSRRGPAFGGVRRWRYGAESQALRDSMRLARAMSRKCALAELPAGGGKVVMIDSDDLDPRAAYQKLAEYVDRLGGRFYTGPDVGTGNEELAWMAERTNFVTHPGEEGPGLLAESTGEGVFRSMEAALRHLDGEVDWPQRVIVIQGLGKVGSHLARRLLECGATVRATEIEDSPGTEVARELGIELLEDSSEFDAECDVFAPCAMGGILHDLTISRLRCRVVVGAANNVLAGGVHGEQLHRRGILFAPDFVVGAGALIRGWHFHVEGAREPVEAIGERVGAVCERIFEMAREEDEPPQSIAAAEADRILRAD